MALRENWLNHMCGSSCTGNLDSDLHTGSGRVWNHFSLPWPLSLCSHTTCKYLCASELGSNDQNQCLFSTYWKLYPEESKGCLKIPTELYWEHYYNVLSSCKCNIVLIKCVKKQNDAPVVTKQVKGRLGKPLSDSCLQRPFLKALTYSFTSKHTGLPIRCPVSTLLCHLWTLFCSWNPCYIISEVRNRG